MSTKAVKWRSTLLIISGLLFTVPILFHPDLVQPGYALLGAWIPVHVLLGISALVGLAGLIAFCGAMNSKTTVVGHVAFWFVIVGTVLMAGMMFLWRRRLSLSCPVALLTSHFSALPAH